MAGTANDHERRFSTTEGEMKSLATKADLAKLETRFTKFVQDSITAQTAELKGALREQSKASRVRAIGATLTVAAPFVISIAAIVVAILK